MNAQLVVQFALEVLSVHRDAVTDGFMLTEEALSFSSGTPKGSFVFAAALFYSLTCFQQFFGLPELFIHN